MTRNLDGYKKRNIRRKLMQWGGGGLEKKPLSI